MSYLTAESNREKHKEEHHSPNRCSRHLSNPLRISHETKTRSYNLIKTDFFCFQLRIKARNPSKKMNPPSLTLIEVKTDHALTCYLTRGYNLCHFPIKGVGHEANDTEDHKPSAYTGCTIDARYHNCVPRNKHKYFR